MIKNINFYHLHKEEQVMPFSYTESCILQNCCLTCHFQFNVISKGIKLETWDCAQMKGLLLSAGYQQCPSTGVFRSSNLKTDGVRLFLICVVYPSVHLSFRPLAFQLNRRKLPKMIRDGQTGRRTRPLIETYTTQSPLKNKKKKKKRKKTYRNKQEKNQCTHK